MKNKKHYRLILSWLLVVVMSIMNVLPAFAQPDAQPEEATVKTGSLIVVVKEKDSDIMLSGNGFSLSNKDTGETYTGVTDDSGTCEFLDIPTGTYTLEDTDPVPDYQVMSKQTIKVEENTEKTFTVQKRKLAVTATLTIKTLDGKEDSLAIAGITFDLFDDSDTKIATVTTTTSGVVTVKDIKPGNYYLIQKNTIGDYVLDDTPTEFSIVIPEGHTSWAETVVVRLYKDSATDHEGDLATANVFIKDKDTGAGIPDVGFTLYKAEDDSVVGIYHTDEAGKIKVLYLEQAAYYFMLTDIPDGYYFDMSHKFEFELKYPVLEHTVNVTAQLQQEMTEGSIKILVTDEESKSPISGVSLTLKNSNGDIVEGSEKTTAADGSVSYENLPFGIYKMQLTSVPEEYPLNQTVYTIDLKQEKPKYTFELKLTQKANLTGTLNLTVVDQDSNKPLSGASFKLYKADGTFIQDVAVDASGTVSVKNLPMGNYYLMENSMPEGYQINNTKKYDFRFEGLLLAANITIKKPYGTQSNSGTLTVTVVDQEDNKKLVVGATLSLLKDSKDGPIFGTYKTDDSGQFTVKNIPLGTYWLSESTMPYGYTISKNKTEITFTSEKPIFNLKLQKLFTDPEGGGGSEGGGSGEGGSGGESTTKTGAIHVTVVDKTTQNPIQNAVIEFHKEDGSLVKEVTTGADGIASVEKLDLDKYYFTEKTMPEGYTPSLEKHRVDLTKFSLYNIKLEKLKAGGEGGGGETPEQQKGTLTIVFKDMDTQKGISGITVELHKATGELVGRSVTKEDGTASHTNLELGDYYFVETNTLEDYPVNTEKRAVTVTNDVPSFTLTVNKMKKGSSGGGQIGDKGKITITVVDMKTKERIKGAVIALYDAATDIKMIDMDSDENGRIELNDLDLKEYYLKEQSMPEGYEVDTALKYRIPLSAEIQTFTFTLQKYKNIPVEPEKPEVLKGSYVLNVVDSSNETIKIEGAKFALYKEDGTKIASYTTNANGNITITDLDYGKYYVQEESMPGRYILNLAKQPFELSDNCLTYTMTIRKAKRSSGGGGGSSSSGGGGGGSSHSSGSGFGGGSATGPGASGSTGGPGVSTPNFNKTPVTNGNWKQEADGRWWYQFNNSAHTYPKDSWECIPSNGNNIWYYFDGEGYMKTGWIHDANGNWRFLNPDGAMCMNTWYFDGTNWFRLNEQGIMQTGWIFVDNNWFYLNPVSDGTRGAMKTGWIFVDNNWFYLNPVSDGTRGAMKTGYQVIDGKAYYFNEVSDGTGGALR